MADGKSVALCMDEVTLINLSKRSKSMWAKVSSVAGDSKWLPLYVHMYDSSEVGRRLWSNWIPYNTKKIVLDGIRGDGKSNATMEDAEKLYVFLSAAHDVGKAMPAFQGRKTHPNTDAEYISRERISATGLKVRDDLESPNEIPHSHVSEGILERNGFDRTVAVVLGGHHGIPPSMKEINRKLRSYKDNTGFCIADWRDVQDELLNYALFLADIDADMIRSMRLSVQAQVILTGAVIMADWMASDEGLFPYSTDSEYSVQKLASRADAAWSEIDLPPIWEPGDNWEKYDLYQARFGYSPHPFQKTVMDIAKKTTVPGIIVIEAPMGEGKTEAALAISEVFVDKFGLSGVIFALPTQATADGIFERIVKWASASACEFNEDRHSLFLAHGKSHYNRNYTCRSNRRHNVGEENEKDSGDGIIVHEWLNGRKKGLLSDFVISTVDQVLMGGLKQRHLAMRHLGLVNKVVIIDECHAYDAYMNKYLQKILQWLGSYGVPVVILSATLPPECRKDLVEAYLYSCRENGVTNCSNWVSNRAYPLVTYTEGMNIKQATSEKSNRSLTVEIRHITDDGLLICIDEMTSSGGYVGIILNTVKRAQDVAKLLRKTYSGDRVHVLHSGFMSMDRTKNEAEVLKILKKENRILPPHREFIVGTQVMEQSLDLDFDLLITDLCPMDLLIQRMGRLHRHDNVRPEPLAAAYCYVLDTGTEEFESGSEFIYGTYHLMNTRALLTDKIRLPEDISDWVAKAYDPAGVPMPKEAEEKYVKAKNDFVTKRSGKETKADVYQLKSPGAEPDLIDWLEHELDDNEKQAEAKVRDTNGSLEVILIQKDEGKFYFLPWVEGYGGTEIPSQSVPNEMAFGLAGCKINLPKLFSAPHVINRAISELETTNCKDLPKSWQDSSWLKGELFLILDRNNIGALLNNILTYSPYYGMEIGTTVIDSE